MRNGNRSHVCGGEGTASVKLFIRALDSSGRQLRGCRHSRSFREFQRHIIVAARTWDLTDVKIRSQIGGEGKRIDLHQRS